MTNESKLREALLPCPFCGGTPSRLDGDGQWCQIGCNTCGARGTEYPSNWDKAEDAWNRRTPSPQPQTSDETPLTDALRRKFHEPFQAIVPSASDYIQALEELAGILERENAELRILSEWVSTKQRLPGKSAMYLTANTEGVDITYFDGDTWCENNGDALPEKLHPDWWMPISPTPEATDK